MATKMHVDGLLVHWGEEILWDERRPISYKPAKPLTYKSKPKQDSAQRVRQHVAALLRKAPEVVVKVSGGGADMRRIGAHMDYIARGGRYKKKSQEELELETDDGQVVYGKDAREALKRIWAQSGAPIPQEIEQPLNETVLQKRKRREALNVILSMPLGVDREIVKAAARATAKALFGANHLYAMAHHSDTDSQHAHVVVKMVGHDGVRLDPRKGDLENWRLRFAKELNLRGVDAVATRRRVRYQRAKGESQAVRQMKERGAQPDRIATSVTQNIPRMRALDNHQRVSKAYTEIAQALGSSPDAEDQKLAQGLQAYLQEHGVQIDTAAGIKPPTPGGASLDLKPVRPRRRLGPR